MKNPIWLRIPVMPDERFPDYASGMDNLDKRRGLLPVTWLCAAVGVVVLVVLLIISK